jgi:hypothetical protein
MKIIYFNSILETIFLKIPKNYPTILIGDVNIVMLKKNSINNISKPYATRSAWMRFLQFKEP